MVDGKIGDEEVDFQQVIKKSKKAIGASKMAYDAVPRERLWQGT